MVVKNKYLKKIVIYVLLFVSILSSLPLESFAHDAYFLQVLVDKANYRYVANVISDKHGDSPESKHKENELGNFTEIDKHSSSTKYNIYKPNSTSLTDDMNNLGTSKGKDYPRRFTFSPIAVKTDATGEKDGIFDIKKNYLNAGNADVDRAIEISSELISNANQMLGIINDNQTYKSDADFFKASDVIISGSGKYNGWSVSSSTVNVKTEDGKGTTSHTVTILKKNGAEHIFKSSMKMGYSHVHFEDGRTSPLYNSKFKATKGYIDTITISSLMIQGNYTYQYLGHTVDNIGEYSGDTKLVKKISEFFANLIVGLRNKLGFYSIEDMVYNQGARNEHLFTGGMMNKQWYSNTIAYHLIFQGIAWMFLVASIVKALFQQNLATLSVTKKTNLMNGVKDLIITGFILITVLLLVNTANNINLRIVDIFHTTVPQYSNIGSSGELESLGGVLMTIYYTGISLYLNFFYIVRSIMLAVLIATAPIFIVSLAFQSGEKKLFNSWLKELTAYMFIQSIHAFVVSFTLSNQLGARGIEVAVSAFSLIIVTNFFKNLIVGQAGGLMGEIASGITGAASGVGVAAFSQRQREKGISRMKEGTGSGGASTGTMSGQNIPGIRETSERKLHSTGPQSSADTKKTLSKSHFDTSNLNSKDGTADKSTVMSSMPFKDAGTLDSQDEFNSKISPAGVGKALGKATATGAQIAGGAMLTMASVATGGNGGLGMKMMGAGAGRVASKTSSAISGAKGGLMTAYNSLDRADHGNILGVRELENGNFQVDRNKASLEKDGFVNAVKTPEGNHSLTYNPRNMSEADLKSLETIERESLTRGSDNKYLQERGIENIQKQNDGNYKVQYNQAGMANLGYKDIYSTPNRVVETKDNSHELASKIIYNPNDVRPVNIDSKSGYKAQAVNKTAPVNQGISNATRTVNKEMKTNHNGGNIQGKAVTSRPIASVKTK